IATSAFPAKNPQAANRLRCTRFESSAQPGDHQPGSHATDPSRAIRAGVNGSVPSSVKPIIDVGKYVVPAFNLGEPRLVDVVALDLLVQVIEIQHMHASPVLSVLHHRAGLHDECPVA